MLTLKHSNSLKLTCKNISIILHFRYIKKQVRSYWISKTVRYSILHLFHVRNIYCCFHKIRRKIVLSNCRCRETVIDVLKSWLHSWDNDQGRTAVAVMIVVPFCVLSYCDYVKHRWHWSVCEKAEANGQLTLALTFLIMGLL